MNNAKRKKKRKTNKKKQRTKVHWTARKHYNELAMWPYCRNYSIIYLFIYLLLCIMANAVHSHTTQSQFLFIFFCCFGMMWSACTWIYITVAIVRKWLIARARSLARWQFDAWIRGFIMQRIHCRCDKIVSTHAHGWMVMWKWRRLHVRHKPKTNSKKKSSSFALFASEATGHWNHFR